MTKLSALKPPTVKTALAIVEKTASPALPRTRRLKKGAREAIDIADALMLRSQLVSEQVRLFEQGLHNNVVRVIIKRMMVSGVAPKQRDFLLARIRDEVWQLMGKIIDSGFAIHQDSGCIDLFCGEVEDAYCAVHGLHTRMGLSAALDDRWIELLGHLMADACF